MVVKALVVDDSGFFRRRIVEILNADPGIEVVGTAANGQEAIEQAARLRPDVITMDIEMPVMDGITAVRRIMARQPMPILMFSSLTFEGAKATLDALDAGAADFLPKRFEDIARDQDEARRVLCRRVRTLGMRRAREREPAAAPLRPTPLPAAVRGDRSPLRLRDLRAVLIGTSTGGPVALQKVLTVLPANFPLPLLLVQHMPASFTPAFAQRLDSLCAIRVKEAADGDVLEPGLALLAPGGRQMVLENRGGQVRVRIVDSEQGQHYKPCVDVTFRSAVPVFGGQVLAVIMTGMGADGREGVRLLREQGARVWVQDEQTSVVYGMPAAVAEAGLADRILPLDQIGPQIAGGM
jgi:two-component system, chemotaxis family, protein-glutamate methylesterase/glutaminase